MYIVIVITVKVSFINKCCYNLFPIIMGLLHQPYSTFGHPHQELGQDTHDMYENNPFEGKFIN